MVLLSATEIVVLLSILGTACRSSITVYAKPDKPRNGGRRYAHNDRQQKGGAPAGIAGCPLRDGASGQS